MTYRTAAVVTLALVCSGGAATCARSAAPALTDRSEETAVTRLPVRLQPLDDPMLDGLAAREHLRDVAPAKGRQFDRILRVKDWVAAQWPNGTPDPYPPWNALIVLDWIRSGKTGGFCGQYAQVLLQSLAALGFNARYVEIGSIDNPYAHYINEVWSNDFDKWVMMDANYNVHFERDGVPMSVLEIHDALLDDTLGNVRPVLGKVRKGHPPPNMWPKKTAELYRYIRYHLKADHLSKPDEPPFDRFNDMVEFEDPRVVSWEQSKVSSPYPKTRLTRQRTTDRAAISAGLNHVALTVLHTTPSAVVYGLSNDVFQFDHYEYRVVQTGAEPWQTLHEAPLTWPSPPSGAWLEVRGVNIRGVAGPVVKASADASP